MKKRIIISVVGLIIVIGVVLFLINMNGRLKYREGTINYYTSEIGIDELKQRYEESEGDPNYQILKTDNPFPSENSKDYINIGVLLNMENKSWFDVRNVNVVIDSYNGDELIIKDNSLEEVGLSSNEKKEVYLMGILAYCGNKSPEEIIDDVKSMEITIMYSNAIRKNIKKHLKLSDMKFTINDVE